MIRNLLSAALAASVLGGLVAQTTGRTNLITSAPVVGGTLGIQVQYPVANAGNFYVMNWSPHIAGTYNFNLPFIVGLYRLDIAYPIQSLYSGSFSGSGAETVNIPVHSARY